MSTVPQGGKASIAVEALAEALWVLVTDITRTVEWSPRGHGVWLDGETGAAVGARFRGSNRRGRTEWGDDV